MARADGPKAPARNSPIRAVSGSGVRSSPSARADRSMGSESGALVRGNLGLGCGPAKLRERLDHPFAEPIDETVQFDIVGWRVIGSPDCDSARAARHAEGGVGKRPKVAKSIDHGEIDGTLAGTAQEETEPRFHEGKDRSVAAAVPFGIDEQR